MLKVENLHVEVEKKKILKGVTVNVGPGEVVVVMGPNGGGKSTLAMTLAGHPAYQVEKGEMRIEKKFLNDLTPDKRAKDGLLLAFQYPSTIEGVTVEQLLRKTVGYKDVLEFRRKIEKEAEKLGIEKSLIKRSLNDGFSGGEKKKMEILQASLMKPKYLILDETDSGLDIDALRQIAKSIAQVVKKNKMGVLLITHYQRFLRYLKPDKICVMVGGKIVESGGGELVRKLEKSGYSAYV